MAATTTTALALAIQRMQLLSCLVVSLLSAERDARPSSGRICGCGIENGGVDSDHVIRVPAKRKIKEIQATAARCRCRCRCRCKLTFD